LKFTVERNPYDKMVSMYFMNWGKSGVDRTGKTFEDWVRREKNTPYNYPLYTWKGKQIVDRVLRYENLNEELSQLYSELGASFSGLDERAKGEYRNKTDYRDVHTEFTENWTNEKFRKEIELHGYKFSITSSKYRHFMKIGIYAGEIPATTFIERLISGLSSSGNEVIVFGSKNKTIEARRNVKLVGISKKFGKLSGLAFYFKYLLLTSLFKRAELSKVKQDFINETRRSKSIFLSIIWHSPDVFHLQWVKGVENYKWVQKLNIKLVVSLRGAHINYSPLANLKLAETYRKVFPSIDGFHGVSKAICIEAAKYGASIEKSKVVYSGFPIANFPKSNWKNSFDDLDSRTIEIVSIGRSHWKKGYAFALDAMHLLKEKGTSFNYTIVGATGNEELLFQRHQLNLEAEVNFVNNLPFEKVISLMRHADILLLPSVEEGIANVVLEAMLLGTLVVSTDCGGMIESITSGKEGLIVPVRNSKAIAEAIISIKEMDKVALQGIADAAYNKVTKQHNEQKMVADMELLYKDVLNV
jgi:colanic acid/amylovoran biosynthesis glycosyltransferase